MHKFAIMLVAVGALALVFVTLMPDSAEARRGWRRGGYWGPGVGVYVGPRYGWGYRRYRRAYANYPYAYYPYWRSPYCW